ncbi:Transcriptional regulator, TetR family [[Actinomadura] parvosata subsp. kistnae]|uniref:TetR family transcriptional regulator n=1 Tax=[Actinomadura] parvosata subsp. kistnae TaxID=1909395 RepID=A0A1U9ZV44_9ACTN|nr:TetR/AcrR family transcriptional regulator [Nonomuraea sp. ATCC 55076]AQZ61824.1 TetR family transcriptional regulator [Nonomuraea sp. ATCC 55076]SPL87958.1 Transcriptional regulator, TetR family [Actinomadura parvosata subsp. kistnae]
MGRPRTTSDEAILGATARAIGRHGPQGLTLAAVAQEAGLSPATLVQRFGSKRGLLLAFAAHAAGAAAEPFQRARQEHRSPLAALQAALVHLSEGVSTPEELSGSLGFLQLDLTDPDFRAHAAEHARRTRDEIAALLADAVAAGELRGDAQAAPLARAVQTTYNGTLILWALTGDGPLPGAMRAALAQTLGPYLAG